MEKIQTGKGNIHLNQFESLLGYGDAEECQICGSVICSHCYPNRPHTCSRCNGKSIKLIKALYPVGYRSSPEMIETLKNEKTSLELAGDLSWTELIRMYLIHRDDVFLNEALQQLKNQGRKNSFAEKIYHGLEKSDIENLFHLIDLWKKGDLSTFSQNLISVRERLLNKNKREEAQTISLLLNDYFIVLAEGMGAIPPKDRYLVFQNGLAACYSCIDIAKQLDDQPLVAGYFVRLGNGLFTAGQIGEARKLFEEALQIWESRLNLLPILFYPRVAETLHHLGNCCKAEKDLAKGRFFIARSVSTYRLLNEVSSGKFINELGKGLTVLSEIVHSTDISYGIELLEEGLSCYENSILHDIPEAQFHIEKGQILIAYGNYLLKMPTKANLKKAIDKYNHVIGLCDELNRIQPYLGYDLRVSAKLCIGIGLLKMAENERSSLERFEFQAKIEAAKRQLEGSLHLIQQIPLDELPQLIPDKINGLIYLSIALMELNQFSKAKQMLDEAVTTAQKTPSKELLSLTYHLLSSYYFRNGEEESIDEHPLGYTFALKAIDALEKYMIDLNPVEIGNAPNLKSTIEISYSYGVKYYFRQNQPEKVFDILEILREGGRISSRSESQLDATIQEARELVAQFNIFYLAVQVIPQGMLFLLLEPSGEISMSSLETGWRKRFLDFYKAVSGDTIRDEKDRDLYTEPTSFSPNADILNEARLLFNELPDQIKILFSNEHNKVFISPYADLNDLPFELLMTPSGEWLGLQKALPRITSFNALKNVLMRQPDISVKKGLVIGDPNSDLYFAKVEAEIVAQKLRSNGFDLLPDSNPIVNNEATPWKFLDYLDEVTVAHFAGHGSFDERGGSLIFVGGDKVRPNHILCLPTSCNPIVFFDCCSSGKAYYSMGGLHNDLSSISIEFGASSVLTSNRLISDQNANQFANIFYDNLLGKGMDVENSLLSARKDMLKNNPNSMAWSQPILWGNPFAKLFK